MRGQHEFYGYGYRGQATTKHQNAYGSNTEILISYVVNANGFRIASNALPQGPEIVADITVAAARSAVVSVDTANPIQDTPQVVAAKKKHAITHQEAKPLAYLYQ